MFCTKCGNEIKEGSRFCTHCGKAVDDKTAENKSSALDKPAEGESTYPVTEKDKGNLSTNKKRAVTAAVIAGIIVIAGGAGFFCRNLINKSSDEVTGQKSQDSFPIASQEAWTNATAEEETEVDSDNIVEDAETTSDSLAQDSGEIVLYQADGYEEDLAGEELQDDQKQEAYGEYILEGSDTRYISKDELEGFDAEKCRYARNELYARHGRKFQDEEIQKYFNDCSWYEGKIDPNDFQESMLNEYEVANRDLIVDYEKEMGYR